MGGVGRRLTMRFVQRGFAMDDDDDTGDANPGEDA
jgi:hypothetical protein